MKPWNLVSQLNITWEIFFLKNNATECDGETSHWHFSGKLKLSISLDQEPKVLYGLFLLYPKLRAIEMYWN